MFERTRHAPTNTCLVAIHNCLQGHTDRIIHPLLPFPDPSILYPLFPSRVTFVVALIVAFLFFHCPLYSWSIRTSFLSPSVTPRALKYRFQRLRNQRCKFLRFRLFRHFRLLPSCTFAGCSCPGDTSKHIRPRFLTPARSEK